MIESAFSQLTGEDVGVAVLASVRLEQRDVRAVREGLGGARDLFVELGEAEVAVDVHLLDVVFEDVDRDGIVVLCKNEKENSRV